MRFIDPARPYLAGQLRSGNGNSAIRGRDTSPTLRSSRRPLQETVAQLRE